MMIVRPIRESDLPSLFELSKKTGKGLTTLQSDEAFLLKRIQLSEHAFKNCHEYGEGSFLFALVDCKEDKIVGISGIESALGLLDPWYNYRVGSEVHASRELNLYHKSDILFLSNDMTGKSEICSLFLDPEYRKNANGHILSKSRFLFMSEFSHLFAEDVIAEMRGQCDLDGVSPFWESLGKHFFNMPFDEADFLTGTGNKTFIAELMPKFPIYTSFLDPAAQAVIGEVHADTKPARAILEKEGFEYRGYIDIFDGGPALQAKVNEVRAVRDSRVKKIRITDQPEGSDRCLIATRTQADFRSTLIRANAAAECVDITPETADCLHLSSDDTIRLVELMPNENGSQS